MWYIVSTVLLVSLTALALYLGLDRSLGHEDDQLLSHLISVVRELLSKHSEASAEVRWEIESEWAARDYTRVYVRVLDSAGRVVAQTPGMGELLPPTVFPPPAASLAELGDGSDLRPQQGQPFRVLSAKGRSLDGGERVIQVALDETVERKQLANYLRGVWVVLGLAALMAALAGYLLARKSIRPVEQITQAARRVRSTTLHERITTAGLPRELLALAETFNEMLDRLQESFARLAQFSADIAHELRTPISNLRGEAEVALSRARSPKEYRQVLESSLEESDRLGRLIETLLFLARAENPRTQVRREPVVIADELARAREFFEPAATEKGVSLEVESANGLAAGLDRELLQRALHNLLNNALAHTPCGGKVTLHAERAGEDGVAIHVIDTGSGIAPEHLSHVFDRFYRVDRARNAVTGGAGLGLSIVQSIARLHDGSVSIASSPGGGTRISLTFPAAPQAGSQRQSRPSALDG